VKAISMPEYGRLERSSLPGRLLRRLQAFDERHGRLTGACVFDWDHLKYVGATNQVGVIQVPGLTIEILPKIDHSPLAADTFGPSDQAKYLAQGNLLYMLALTGSIPAHYRGIAGLRPQRMSLLESLIAVFVEKLLGELRKGIHHAYVTREENSVFMRGKLLVAQQIRHNAVHDERTFVQYEEFVPDTPLNRIFKATCHRLLAVTGQNVVQQRLREALVHFADVQSYPVRLHDFDRLHMNRDAERFSSLLAFCRMVLLGTSPAPSLGDTRTFSLLFPMEVLYEQFVAQFMLRHAETIDVNRGQVHIQARHKWEWLLRSEDDKPKFRLKPDIIIDHANGKTRLLIDTKWKRLKSDFEDAKNGVSQADLYQMFAYCYRFESPDNVLLYPKVDGVTPKAYRVAGDETKRLRVAFVDLNRDLTQRWAREALANELREIIHGSATSRVTTSM